MSGKIQLFEGRFIMPGDKPTGVLGMVSTSWEIVTAKARGMGETEKWLARSVVRAVLQALGGVERDGRIHVELDLGGNGDLEQSVMARVQGIEEKLVELSGQVAANKRAIEAISQHTNLDPLREDIKALKGGLQGLRMLVGRAKKADDAAPAPSVSSVSDVAAEPSEG